MTTVAVIDYGMGNIRSVAKALEHVSGAARVEVTHDAQRILRADRVVLPGVGALRDCMAEIERLALADVIRECVRTRPFLGICLGLQALFDESAENGGTAGLGILPGRVSHFGGIVKTPALGATLKIPHMGWNQVRQLGAHRLWEGVPQDSRFYFVHSYYVEPEDPAIVAGTAEYGAPFAAAVAHGNIFAVQFHPEKSQHEGLRMLANFVNWDGG